MLDQTTKRKIDTARDILVGKVPDPKQQVDQITNALIYKFMDDMDKESQELGGEAKFFTDEFEKYSWTKLLDKRLSGQERQDIFSQAIANMPRNPHIPQLFRDVFKGAFLPYRDPETLSLFLKEIDGFTYDHSEDLGDAFEYLLSVLGSQGDAGQFRTPRHIIDFIVEVIDPKKNETILDPACGTAGFLISAYKHILRQHDGKDNQTGQLTTDETRLTPDDRKKMMNNFVGYDISPDMVKLSLVNMYLHGFPEPKIYEYDTLTSEKYWDDQFDVIMANPPFMTPKGGIRPHNRFRVSANRSEVLFVSYIMDHLNLKGRAGIIVPEGIIFQSANAYKDLRKKLIEDGLFAVISLPPGVFNPYSGVKTSILFFDNALAKSSSRILFLGIGNDGFSLGAQRSPIKGNQIPEVQKIIEKFKENPNISQDDLQKYARTIDTERILSNGADWVIEPLIVEKSKINESGDYNLTWSRYKETEINKNQQWPIIELGNDKYFTIESGGTPDSKNLKYWDGEINWATLVDLPADNLISEIAETKRKITELGLMNSSAKLLPINSILISSRATIGRIAINKVELATNQGFKNIVIQNFKLVEPKFVAYILTRLIDQMISMASGGTFKEISKNSFSKLKIPLPPLEIQKQIVEEIEGYQKIIDGSKQIISSWKPKINIDSEWKLVRLEDVCELIQRGKSPKYGNSQVQVIKSGQARGYCEFDFTNKFFVDEDFSIDHRKLQKGDLLLNSTGVGTAGRITLFNFDGDYLADSHITIIRTKKDLAESEYVLYALDSVYGFKALEGLARGNGGQIELGLPIIKELIIPLPPLEVQKQLVEKIEEERKIVEGNKRLIEIYEKKIEEVISKI